MFYPLICCHRKDEVRNTAPQSTVLVEVHSVVRHRAAVREEPLLKVVIHHLLQRAQTDVGCDVLFFFQQHCEDQKGLLVGCVLMVTVAIENERGARRQLLESVNDSRRFASIKSFLQPAVNVQFDLVAVLAGFTGSINVEEGRIVGGGEGRGQASSQAVQRLLSSEAGSQNEAHWLCGLGRLEMPLQVDPGPSPELRLLVTELILHFIHLSGKLDAYIVSLRWGVRLVESK